MSIYLGHRKSVILVENQSTPIMPGLEMHLSRFYGDYTEDKIERSNRMCYKITPVSLGNDVFDTEVNLVLDFYPLIGADDPTKYIWI